MKKLAKKLSCLIIFSLFLFGAFLTFHLNEKSALNCNLMATAADNSVKINCFDSLADAITSITSKYQTDDDSLFLFNKDQDLIMDSNGEYLVAKDTFANITDIILESSCQDLYKLNDLAATYGYEIETSELSVALLNKFGTKRLLIQTQDLVIDTCDAVAVSSFEDYYILQFASKEETRTAYDFYKSMQYDVCVDSIRWLDNEIDDASDTNLSAQDIPTNSYYSWGAKVMGIDHRIDYLNSIIKAQNNNYTKLPEVVIAVMDSGIDTDHPWFKDRFLYDEKGKIVGKGFQFRFNGYTFEDDDGHGTFCSGVICDLTLPNVKILPIKYLCKNIKGVTQGNVFNEIASYDYILKMKDQYNIVAVNMSFSGTYDSITYQLTKGKFKKFYEKGIACVAAAGNDSKFIDDNLPIMFDHVIGVSALDEDLTLGNYSNYGNIVDVCAPGTDIESAYLDGTTAIKYGTSVAVPHISAYIALVKSDPLSNYTVDEIHDIVTGNYYNPYEEQYCYTVRNIGAVGKDIFYGYGLPNFFGFLRSYVTVDFQTDSFGKISPSGFNLFFNSNTSLKIPIKFYPKDGYYQSMFLANGRLYEDVTKMTEYTFKTSRLHESVRVTFVKGYVVNHYLEGLTSQSTSYQLNDSEVYIGELNDLSLIKPNDYQGFTSTALEYQLIGNSNIVNLYYKRNEYNITINYNYNGEITSVSKTVKYGDDLASQLNSQKGYKLDKVTCNGVELNLKDASSWENINSNLELTVNLSSYTFNDMNLFYFGLCIVIGISLVFILMKLTKPRVKK